MTRAVVVLTGALLALVVLAGPPASAQQVERVTMVGGPPAGMFGIFATGIGTYLSKSVPNLNVSVAATAGSVENLRRINAGEAEIGISFAGDVHEGFNGLEKFQGKPTTSVRAIGVVFMGVVHLVTFADTNIKTLEDVAGKRVAVGNPGSGTFATAERIFRAVGLWDKITRVPLLGAAAGQAVVEGKADAFFWTGPAPDRVTTEAAASKPVRILDVYAPVSKTDFFKQYPYFARYVYAGGSYRGMTENVDTIGVPALWIANKDVPAALVQKITGAVYGKDGNAHMVRVHAGARDMTPDKALGGITIPLHAGAEAAWKELGVTVSDAIRAR
jgi:TRAP transporter TAXI family solute receptor